ncbi:LysR family transcriptional regulator [Streptomyces xanthii]|uniref:LysR family transcriptional regulator n=2 Tax=Streptomyces xanthii TaxID=2768069 RepID=A0A7H1BK72_9ACTN|nr:LysR family transcriptional regulator [Streptomyces xanthii]
MERQELEAFLALAEELHFGRTAHRLGLSAGRISQVIKALERRVGVPLFERNNRRVALTPVGERLRDDLLPARRIIDEALARAVAAGRGITGSLRIGYSSSMAANLLLNTMETFRTSHPDCDVTIQEIQLSDPYGPLRSEQVHLQITELPVDEPDLDSGPVLYTSPRALLVSSSHPMARRETVSLEDLTHETLLTIGGTVPQHWLDYNFPRRTPSGRPIPQGHAAISWQEIPFLVAAGQGVSLACTEAEPHYSTPGVTWIPVQESLPCHFAAIWPRHGMTTRVRAFLETLHKTTPAGRR